jgi:periplasmic protein TonB
MTATTINTFPPFQAMNSPRGWILALIVLLHFGFFVLLSSGMGTQIIHALRPPSLMVVPPTEQRLIPPEPQVRPPVDLNPVRRVYVPEPTPLTFDEFIEEPLPSSTSETPLSQGSASGEATADPIVTQPDIDPRIGLSEPVYPAAAIRAGQTGVVLLSVYVLEDGRVGDVRLDQSSGYQRLDDSAVREARRWRLRPGMRDGVAIAMWKQIPVTFRLQSSGSQSGGSQSSGSARF